MINREYQLNSFMLEKKVKSLLFTSVKNNFKLNIFFTNLKLNPR